MVCLFNLFEPPTKLCKRALHFVFVNKVCYIYFHPKAANPVKKTELHKLKEFSWRFHKISNFDSRPFELIPLAFYPCFTY